MTSMHPPDPTPEDLANLITAEIKASLDALPDRIPWSDDAPRFNPFADALQRTIEALPPGEWDRMYAEADAWIARADAGDPEARALFSTLTRIPVRDLYPEPEDLLP
jgi:hypothetical protein